MMEIMASCYDGKDSRDSLAWPYHAKKDILKGLPLILFVSMNLIH